MATANAWTTGRTHAFAVALLLGSAAPLIAQGSASMGVSVVVGTVAARPTVTREAASFSTLTSGAVEMRSRMAVFAGGEYTLRIRSNGSATASDAAVSVRNADGSFTSLSEGGSALIAHSAGATQSHVSDLVVRMARFSGSTQLTAEIIAAPLDQ
jgi:hypothetical protein